MKGFINILKSPGYTSQDVVSIVRGILSKEFGFRIKVGHLGTLDPLASGVLPLAFGYSTRLFDIFQESPKKYRATITFLKETDTLDSQGKVINETNILPSEEDIKIKLKTFIGKQKQIPPKYSSKLVNGKRAYDLARENKDFTLKPKEIEIYNIDFISFNKNVLELYIEVSSGTYIRSFARDLAYSLNTLAYMSSLIRLETHKFNIEQSNTIDEFSKNPKNFLLDIEDYLTFDKLYLNDEEYKIINTIGSISKKLKNNTRYWLYYKNNIFAIGLCENETIKKEVVLWDILKN